MNIKENYAKSLKILNRLPSFNVVHPFGARVLYFSLSIKGINYTSLRRTQHSHTFYELHIPMDSNASMNIGNRFSVTAPKGGGILLYPGTNHSWDDTDELSKHLSITFIPDDKAKYFFKSKEGYSVIESNEVFAFFADYISKFDYSDAEKSMAFISFGFSFIMEETVKPEKISQSVTVKEIPKQNYVERAKQYIITHYNERPTVKKVAEHVFISSKQLNRLFREKENITVSEYINNIICFESKRMLAKKDLPTSVVAAGMGFSSAGAFSNYIKYHLGKTPGSLREDPNLTDDLLDMSEEYK